MAGLAQKQKQDAARPCAHLQPAAFRQAEALGIAADLQDHGGKGRHAERRLRHPERIGNGARPGEQEAGRIEAVPLQPWPIRGAGFGKCQRLADPQSRATAAFGQVLPERGKGERKARRSAHVAGLCVADLHQPAGRKAAVENSVKIGRFA
ncbi:hypothetical protein [Mycoplana dimorpha]|uniref:hypothetical protein n=1 Tax=Mycoplana dimorpha TaxID=28320 RepID=UPI0014736C64|nr:hypothetical protein [Mycoplana dimorpha]